MARLEFGKLREAWRGEASDFTPLLNEQLDALGAAIGVDLASVGKSEVLTTGGRRIDIVAQGEDGAELVVENQYGSGNHDHLTRGLAYAVARRARGLVVVAEQHRDEFRAVAQYLNELAEHDDERGVAVWLVEAQAVRIEGSPWAPLFTAVVEPNTFTRSVEAAKTAEARPTSDAEFLAQIADADLRAAAQEVLDGWVAAGHSRYFGPRHVVLTAKGPSKNGRRSVVNVYSDGQVLVPFWAYAGQNTGIPIPSLTTDEFRATASALFGFKGSEGQGRTSPGWLSPERADQLLTFGLGVADAYTEIENTG